ncbi:MAG TPA: ROK family protein [Candidatus Kapabacteria bacterium]
MSYVLGVDIGGTTIKLGVVEIGTGKIAAESSVPTPQTGSHPVAVVVTEQAHILQAAFPELNRMGVGVPGAMNRDRSLVRYPPNLLGWKEEPLREYLAELLPSFLAIEVDNDAKVAAIAEAKLGAAQGLSHFLLVTLGTGIGGAIYFTQPSPNAGLEKAGEFIDRIYRGASGGAGEFGHTSIDLNGPPCNCGSRGCIEAYLGQRYLSERTKQKLLNDLAIHSMLRDEEEELTPKRIADAMNAGDRFAQSVFEEAGTLLGAALANVANLLDMHVFILGGGVAEAGPVLFDSALQSLRARVLANLRPEVEIRKAQFGNRAGMIGAAMLVTGQP